MKHIKVSIIGASGYTGMETIRFLLQHPVFDINHLYGLSSSGQRFDQIYPAFTEVLEFEVKHINDAKLDTSDAIVVALPHGISASVVHEILSAGFKGSIIDLGSDFRLKSADDNMKWYNFDHPYINLSHKFIYGLTEFNRSAIKNADYIANPGCFATAVQMGLLPLLAADPLTEVHITGLTGSSGSGSDPSPTTHFSTRDGNLKSYKTFKHQHLGEVYQQIEHLSLPKTKVNFVPVSAPVTRGIWITISGRSNTYLNLNEIFESTYYNAPLVRLRQTLPELKHVVGSAFTDIGWQQDGDSFVVGVAIDNIGKGAASQAIQNLNLMFDLPEETGLMNVGYIL
jgi:N-acetyl-gamma-glutamyl-phosphate reductase common form